MDYNDLRKMKMLTIENRLHMQKQKIEDIIDRCRRHHSNTPHIQRLIAKLEHLLKVVDTALFKVEAINFAQGGEETMRAMLEYEPPK